MAAYEVVIIGAGPGGYVCAIRAAQLGFKVALIEKNNNLGGTCLNVGCIPSKALLSSTEHYHFAKERFASHGILCSDLKIDLGAMLKRKEQVVTKLNTGVASLLKKNKIDRIIGTGRLLSAYEVEVTLPDGSKETVEAENIVLATGSAPVAIPGLEFDGKRIISSTEALCLTEVPKNMIVVGAGAIGLELGSVWSRLGAKVTVVEFLDRIAPGCDAEVAKFAQRQLEKQGLSFMLSTSVDKAEAFEGGVRLTATREKATVHLDADIVLVAVGRRPYTDHLGLEAAGVALTERGRIKVDAHLRTSAKNIFAIGDVVDGPMLAHKAEDEGVALAERLAGKPGHVNYQTIPNVIYTSPEIAAVGISEEAAKAQGTEVRVGKFNLLGNGRSIASDTTDGMVKIIADAKTDRVLGVHVVAAQASELIAEAVVLMEFGGSAEDLARTVHSHPTVSEAIKEAAMAVSGRAIHG